LNTRVNNIVSIPVSLLILAAPLSILSAWIGDVVAISIVVFVALNRPFLAFLLRKKGFWFTMGGAVMTWFAYLYSGLGALVGLTGYVWERWGKSSAPGARNAAAVPGRSRDLPP
jgi:hypothetical protein